MILWTRCTGIRDWMIVGFWDFLGLGGLSGVCTPAGCQWDPLRALRYPYHTYLTLRLRKMRRTHVETFRVRHSERVLGLRW